MKLRNLEKKDATLILECMRDKIVNKYLNDDFSSLTIQDVENYIMESSAANQCTIHRAIVSDEDEYMGMVSLTNIDRENSHAEFEIVVRQVAFSKGYAWFGLEEILQEAFNTMGLDCVYWNVNRDNERAIRFFDKHNIHETVDIPINIINRYKERDNLKWYSVLEGDLLDVREEVVGCKVIRIKTVPTVNKGELSFFEGTRDVNFEIKRIYYISKVPEGVRRGFHAHKELKQILFCLYGRIQLILENQMGREEIELSDPSIGVIIEKTTWREMLWLQKDSVLCVAASDYYNTNDYIREYSSFKEYIREL